MKKPAARRYQHFKHLRRRRDFLANRINNHHGDPAHDKAECSALTWALHILEALKESGNLADIERDPHNPAPSESVSAERASLDARQFDLRRLRQEAFELNECPNGPDEDGTWPCDPKPGYGVAWAECQVCGRVGEYRPKELVR